MQKLRWDFVPEEIQNYYQEKANEIFEVNPEKIVVTTLDNKVDTWISKADGSGFELFEEKKLIVLPENQPFVVIRFDYRGFKNDPTPEVAVLGQYIHERTGNAILSGVNLNYIEPPDMALRLAVVKQAIKTGDTLPERVSYLRYQWGKLFNRYFREYFIDMIENVRIIEGFD